VKELDGGSEAIDPANGGRQNLKRRHDKLRLQLKKHSVRRERCVRSGRSILRGPQHLKVPFPTIRFYAGGKGERTSLCDRKH